VSYALGQAKHRLAIGLDREPLFFETFNTDQWVIKKKIGGPRYRPDISL
jgi:hypothetical protein